MFVAEKLIKFCGNVKKRFRDLKPKDVVKFTAKEGIGLIPIAGPIIKDALDEFSPDEKLELLSELKNISETNFIEISNEIGVSVDYLKDIRTLAYYKFEILEANHEEIKQLIHRLIENQTKFEIGCQKVEAIYNVAGDLVIQNPITHEPICIPKIQSVLKKGENEAGGFFKSKPKWVDFEQGYIVERKEVKDIINKLNKSEIQLVLGAPASGKSLLLKNVGYRLANENKNVYVIELKEHPLDEIKYFFKIIPNINDAIFIVDDAHLYLSYCERLVKEFKRRGRGNLIIGSRDSREITKEHPKEGVEYELLSELSKTCIHIHTKDVTESMIRTFFEKQNFDNDRTKTASNDLVDFKEDLWFLSWALKSYKNSVNIDDIYEKISYTLQNIKVGKEKDSIIINAENVFLPLSIFYRFEIPVERYFLEDELGINDSIINQLIRIQEILEMKDMLSLHHSSLAKLYYESYKKDGGFGRKVKKNILNGRNKEDLEFHSFFQYMTTTDSRNSIDIVIYLGRDWGDKKGGKTLIKRLTEENKIQESIEKGIKKEKDIEKIAEFMFEITMTNHIAGWKLANNIGIPSLLAKIEEEEDIEKSRRLLESISNMNSEMGLKLVETINIDILSLKINKEENIEKIGKCMQYIANVSEEVGIKLVSTIISKIEKEEDLSKINSFVSWVGWGSKKVQLELVNRIDIDSLLTKIEKEEDIEKIGPFVWVIVEASNKVGLKLVETINIDILSLKINKENDIEKIRKCMQYIAEVSGDVGLKLVNSIDINILSAKIEKEDNINMIGKCVGNVAGISKELGIKLVDTLSAKIENEKDITNIGLYVWSLSRRNKEMGFKLINSIDFDIFLSKIKKEHDIKVIGMCVANIGFANEDMENKIINNLNPNIQKQIQKRLPHWKDHVKLLSLCEIC